jgi:hypothetical protein
MAEDKGGDENCPLSTTLPSFGLVCNVCNIWGPAKKVCQQFIFMIFHLLDFNAFERQLQSFEGRDFKHWILAPYMFLIASVILNRHAEEVFVFVESQSQIG